jgi:hypothetical protein
MPAPRLKPGERNYYVIAPGMQNLSGHPIWEDADGNRRISMTPSQAKYWLDQAAISENAPSKHSAAAKGAFRQMHGGPRTTKALTRETARQKAMAKAAPPPKAPEPAGRPRGR